MEWFKHDVNAHDDIKIRKLVRMHGIQAYGVYWELVELMYGKGGALPGDNILDEIMLMGITEDDARDMMESFTDLGLFKSDSNTWTSDRVEAEISAANTIRQKMSELGKRSGAARQRVVNAPLTSRQRTVNAPLNETIEENRDYNLGSPLQEENLSINTKDKTDKTEIVCSEPSQRLEAGTPENAVFVTIISNKGEEIPITENMVSLWEKTYPAVDVRSELLRMKSWAIANPKNRKTRSGMQRFCDNWLARTQNEARRIPQGNHETIRGTNIRMSLVADGTRPEYPEPEVKFE